LGRWATPVRAAHLLEIGLPRQRKHARRNRKDGACPRHGEAPPGEAAPRAGWAGAVSSADVVVCGWHRAGAVLKGGIRLSSCVSCSVDRLLDCELRSLLGSRAGSSRDRFFLCAGPHLTDPRFNLGTMGDGWSFL